MTKDKGPLIIVSGPAGSGKSTVVGRLLAASARPLRAAVSATTRPARPRESDGKHYHFWGRERFLEALRRGEFLEHAEVHGNYYGTLRAEVERYREEGVGILLVIDVQGAEQVRRQYPEAVTVFLKAASPAVLEARLRGRGTESEEAIWLRLAAAAREEARSGEYQHVLVNADLDQTVAALRQIVESSFERGSHAG
jgi:guanylate kinase